MADVVVSVGTRTKKVEVTVLMSCTGVLCLLLPLLSLVLYKAAIIPHILFPDRFIASALRGREPKRDHPILPPPPEFQHPSPSNRLPYAAPPSPPSPAGSPHFETYRLGRKLIAIGDCHPPSPPPLILDCNKAPPSNPPPPPPPPSPENSPDVETYRLGRKLIDIGDCHPPSLPPLLSDCNKAPASNHPLHPSPPPSPADSPHIETFRLGRKLIAIGDCHPSSSPPLILDCDKAPASKPPPPPPPPPPSPADSPHFETYRLGRKLIDIGDCYLPNPPPLMVDCNYTAGECFQVNTGLLQVVLQGKAFSFAEWQASTDIFVGFQRRST